MHFITGDYGKLKNRPRYRLEAELTEFVKMDLEMVKCRFEKGRYSSPSSAQNSINQSAKRHGLPVRAVMHEGEIYLVRTDM